MSQAVTNQNEILNLINNLTWRSVVQTHPIPLGKMRKGTLASKIQYLKGKIQADNDTVGPLQEPFKASELLVLIKVEYANKRNLIGTVESRELLQEARAILIKHGLLYSDAAAKYSPRLISPRIIDEVEPSNVISTSEEEPEESYFVVRLHNDKQTYVAHSDAGIYFVQHTKGAAVFSGDNCKLMLDALRATLEGYFKLEKATGYYYLMFDNKCLVQIHETKFMFTDYTREATPFETSSAALDALTAINTLFSNYPVDKFNIVTATPGSSKISKVSPIDCFVEVPSALSANGHKQTSALVN
jgi:hypothetical protein